ncbi:MAG: hypothetical protein ACWGQW_26600, partial [bacterium]
MFQVLVVAVLHKPGTEGVTMRVLLTGNIGWFRSIGSRWALLLVEGVLVLAFLATLVVFRLHLEPADENNSASVLEDSP